MAEALLRLLDELQDVIVRLGFLLYFSHIHFFISVVPVFFLDLTMATLLFCLVREDEEVKEQEEGKDEDKEEGKVEQKQEEGEEEQQE